MFDYFVKNEKSHQEIADHMLEALDSWVSQICKYNVCLQLLNA